MYKMLEGEMSIFYQDGVETSCPIGIGLELQDSMKGKKDLKEGTEFEVVVFDIDHYEKLHCKVTNMYSWKIIYQIISKKKYIPPILKEIR